jgi:hypothetical protein
MSGNVENARVASGSQESQSTLFPLSDFSCPPVSPRALCARINLNWMMAERLYENGWLSFDPCTVTELTPPQNAELCFLGGLIVGGCEESMLRHLLAGLVKPYSYRLDRMYYDWESQCWQLSPNTPDMAVHFESWLEQLVDSGEMSMLERLRATVDRSIADLRHLRYW